MIQQQPATPDEPVGPSASESAEREWWDDPNLPWKHKPTRSDISCWVWITIAGIYGLVMIPLRAWLLTVPYISALLTGSRAAIVAIGAFVTTRHDPVAWWLPTLIVAALSAMKWDWLYWWAGKLWGNNLIDVWTAGKPRYRRWADKLEAFTRKHPLLGLILTYFPIPLITIVYVVMGASRVKLRTFLGLDFLIAICHAFAMFYLGRTIGLPAVQILNMYSKIATYVGVALLVVVLASVFWRQRKQPAGQAPRG